MRGDSTLINIRLEKRPNGRPMKFPKPMRIKRGDAARLVDSGRASYISKSVYRSMLDAIPVKVKGEKAVSKGSKKKERKKRGWKKK